MGRNRLHPTVLRGDADSRALTVWSTAPAGWIFHAMLLISIQSVLGEPNNESLLGESNSESPLNSFATTLWDNEVGLPKCLGCALVYP